MNAYQYDERVRRATRARCTVQPVLHRTGTVSMVLSTASLNRKHIDNTCGNMNTEVQDTIKTQSPAMRLRWSCMRCGLLWRTIAELQNPLVLLQQPSEDNSAFIYENNSIIERIVLIQYENKV